MKRLTTLTCTLLLLLSSCSDRGDDIAITPSDESSNAASEASANLASGERLTNLAPVTAQFQLAAQSAIDETLALCRQLESQIQAFLDNPTEAT